MVKQERAVRTRKAILTAAAKIFEERGYRATTISDILSSAGVTKGALYFHFSSKEELAQGILHGQDQWLSIPDRACKIQQIADTVLLHAYRLQHEPMVRAGVRLSLDQQAEEVDRRGPFTHWGEIVGELLEKAQAQGELLPHVSTAETADVLVGSFAGVQAMSQVMSDYQDLLARVAALLRHLLPSIVLPSVLAAVDITTTRADIIAGELRPSPAEQTAARQAVPAS
ncbi:ScbR family autoregulator-binding transcription factor [Streptomyces prasinus]|uniref:ScbR family autoregulator-binding transcription factor n=1 Tax=Streptomyces prasinus TaxID=67345 RepID=UPI0006EB5D9C|nr:ScbR family autoregulator-binding transcription factor [Streptomyces prasinus]